MSMPFGISPEAMFNTLNLDNIKKGKEGLEKAFENDENKEKGFKEKKAGLLDKFREVLEKIENKTYENMPDNEEEKIKLVKGLEEAQQAVNKANSEVELQKVLDEMNEKQELKKFTGYEAGFAGK